MSINNKLSKYSEKEYFKGYQYIWCMIFLNNILMILPHIVFNILFVLIYDKCYPLHIKIILSCVCSGYCQSNNFRLTKIFDLVKLSLKI